MHFERIRAANATGVDLALGDGPIEGDSSTAECLAMEVALALIAVGGTLFGVIVGGLIEARRDDRAWTRQTSTRWLADLREVLARFLEVSDRCLKSSAPWHTATEQLGKALETRAERPPDPDEEGGDNTEAAMDAINSMRAFSDAFDQVGRVRAEIDFIGTPALREAAEQMQDALWSATGGQSKDEDIEAYWEARAEFIEQARAALQSDRAAASD